MLESAIAIKSNTNAIEFSVQYFIDCARDNWGCYGGMQSSLYEYAAKNGYYLKSDYYYPNYLGL